MTSINDHGSQASKPWNFTATLHCLAKSQSYPKHLFEDSRFRGSLVSVYDYNSEWVSSKDPVRVRLDFSDPRQEELTHEIVVSLRHTTGGGKNRRVIIIEDLCCDLARALSNAFDLSPEMCEDYLVNSSWEETERYRDDVTTYWPTRRVQQEHFTLRWHRPGTLTLRNLGEEMLELSRESGLQQTRRGPNIQRQQGQEPYQTCTTRYFHCNEHLETPPRPSHQLRRTFP